MLKGVTFTGAGDHTDRVEMRALSLEFNFIEWGVLFSNRSGGARYPGQNWIRNLQQMATLAPMNLSLHLCGDYVRQLVLGDNIVPNWALAYFKRVQLNFHGEPLSSEPGAFAEVLSEAFGNRQVIFQIDGATGQQMLADAHGEGHGNCVPLFDLSHGGGVLPAKWPEPFDDEPMHGYAGGLGPHNLADELPKILKVAGKTDVWIDMETMVRTEGQFDLKKCRQCVEIALPFYEKGNQYAH